MERERRVEVLERVADLMAKQRAAIFGRDVDTYVASMGEINAALHHLRQDLDSPASPSERARAMALRRVARSNHRLILDQAEVLRELGALAHQQGLAVALDSQA